MKPRNRRSIREWYQTEYYAQTIVHFLMLVLLACTIYGLTATGVFKKPTIYMPTAEYLHLQQIKAEELEHRLTEEPGSVQELILFEKSKSVIVLGTKFEQERIVTQADLDEIKLIAEAARIPFSINSGTAKQSFTKTTNSGFWVSSIALGILFLMFLFKRRDEEMPSRVKSAWWIFKSYIDEKKEERGWRTSLFWLYSGLCMVAFTVTLFGGTYLLNDPVHVLPAEYAKVQRTTAWQLERHLLRAPHEFKRVVVIKEMNAVFALVHTEDVPLTEKEKEAAQIIEDGPRTLGRIAVPFGESASQIAAGESLIKALQASNVKIKYIDPELNRNIFSTSSTLWVWVIYIVMGITAYWMIGVASNWRRWMEEEGFSSKREIRGAVAAAVGPDGKRARSTIGDVVVAEEDKKTLADVAGCDEAIEKFRKVAEWINDAVAYQHFDAKLPKGVLLTGPPGTGKTLLARALAGEVDGNYFYASGSEFVNMYVGKGSDNVRKLFEKAKKSYQKTGKPSIVFIDEIDAVGKKRSADGAGGESERDQTVNQLLTCIQGFDPNNGTLVIAATNRADMLDEGLTRSGRFDYKIEVGKPDKKGRTAIYGIYLRNRQLEDGVCADELAADLATRSHDFVGADIELVANVAASTAAERNAPAFKGLTPEEVKDMPRIITVEDFHGAVDEVMFGQLIKSKVRSDEERMSTAIHEIGHAAIPTELGGDPVSRITIVMTTKSLGHMESHPAEDRYGWTKEQFILRIKMMLAGRAAEEMIGKSCSTGASNDFERASQLARVMTGLYGMTDELGVISIPLDQYGFPVSNIGPDLQADFNKTWREIIDECNKETRQIIEGNRGKIERIAQVLFEEETLTGDQFRDMWSEAA